MRFVILSSFVVLAGCSGGSPPADQPRTAEGEPPPTSSAAPEAAAPRVHTLADCLAAAERDRFNHLAMGSELIPLEWLRALRSQKTSELFLQGIERFGLIPHPRDPHGLPIGLTAA